jgi:uncharacterized protein (TIGR04255 family)
VKHKEAQLTSPFTEASPVEVPLSRAPLVKVLAQLKFPVNARIDTTEGIAGLQDLLRESYPVMRQEQQIGFAVPLGSPPIGMQAAAATAYLWRLSNLDNSWTVVIARDFLAIETSRYTSRDDFLEHFEQVLEAMTEADLSPVVSDRLGIRYIDRIEGEEMISDLPLLVRRELLGVGDVELPESSEIVGSMSQTQLRIDDLQIRAGWGLLPPNAIMLPGIDGVDTKTWVLDVDVYTERVTPFSIQDVVSETKVAADHAYRFFRWAVTDEFLRRHGGAL